MWQAATATGNQALPLAGKVADHGVLQVDTGITFTSMTFGSAPTRSTRASVFGTLGHQAGPQGSWAPRRAQKQRLSLSTVLELSSKPL
jgi:hypothetical protein